MGNQGFWRKIISNRIENKNSNREQKKPQLTFYLEFRNQPKDLLEGGKMKGLLVTNKCLNLWLTLVTHSDIYSEDMEEGWRSGESTSFPPIWPRTRH